jgi:hypothetical protein
MLKIYHHFQIICCLPEEVDSNVLRINPEKGLSKLLKVDHEEEERKYSETSVIVP